MSYRSHTAAPSRVFDHLYDPIFTSSDPRNVAKEDCIALMRSAPIQIYPVLDSMFSEMSYEERNCYAYQKNTLPFTPSVSSSINVKTLCVTGADRTKFFKNPINNVQTVNVGLMADDDTSFTNFQVNINSTEVQTIYRESSAQTRPFLPECFANEINDDQDVPEVAYIAGVLNTITYPGVKEVEIIERSRKRRQWEISLPPMQGPEDIKSRATALEVFEWEEWITREREINECQHARLQIVADLILKREQKQKSLNDTKIERCKKMALQERNRQKCLLLRKYQRDMRKLDLAQRKDSMGERRTDPVLTHFDRKNDYSFPKINSDVLNKKHPKVEYTDKLEARFATMEKDSNAMFEDLQMYLNSKKKVSLWKSKPQGKEVEKGIWNENYLKNLHNTLKMFRFKKFTQRKNIKIYKELTADSSESFKMLNESTEKPYNDSLLLQKTIKGRSIQNMLQKGVKNFRDVIEEAREEFSEHINTQNVITLELKQIEDKIKNDLKLQEDLKKIESKDTKTLLSFLEKELNRLQGEKRAHALFILAERERYYREASTFMEQHDDTMLRNDAISLYLENVLMEGINSETEELARDYVRRLTRKIDQIASIEPQPEKVSRKNSKAEIHEIASEIKDQIYPHIIDRLNNEHLRIKQNALLEKVHQDLFKEEFVQKELEEQEKVCSEIIEEIIENATKENFSALTLSRQESIEADELATRMVKQILNEITLSKEEIEFKGHFSYDDDNDDVSNIPSLTETETESSTDVLVKQFVHDALIDALENRSPEQTDGSDL